MTGADPTPRPPLDEAWKEAEAALPEGWHPVALSVPDEDWTKRIAYTCSRAFFEGENDNDAEQAEGTGPTPALALQALAARLREAQGG